MKSAASLACVLALAAAPAVASAQSLPDLPPAGSEAAPPSEPSPRPDVADDDDAPAPRPAPRRGPMAVPRAEPAPAPAPPATVPYFAASVEVSGPPAPPSPPRKYAQRYVGFEVGARGTFVRDAGLDPYAADDLVAGLSLGATWEPLRLKPVHFGLAAEYDYGSRSSRARGVPSSLAVHRASIGVRVRWEAARWVSVYAKASPGVLHLRGSLSDAALDRPLVARPWTWTVDTTAGLGFPIVTVGDKDWPATRLWILLEGGYAFAGAAAMRYAPVEDVADARQFGSVDLPSLRASGAVSRIAIAMSF